MTQNEKTSNNRGVILNLYPDSCGGNLTGLITLLKKPEMKNVFTTLYLLPSLFQSDLDRGFSIISYDMDNKMGTRQDLKEIQDLGYRLKLDFVLNHLSVQSPQFQDLLKKGNSSPYKEFFIDWNQFWKGEGTIGDNGCIIPSDKWLNRLFMRKPGLPVLEIPFADGNTHFYWNTFYQEVTEERGEKKYLGQMDLNSNSELVWDFYKETMDKLSSYGADIVRLDAFAYLHKEIGQSNFFNEPGTWDILERLNGLAKERNILLLPEIHSRHEEGIHKKITQRGFPVYDFFFPGLIIYALEEGDLAPLIRWMNEIKENNYQTVNMLGCHDGIPILDMQGLLNREQINHLIDLLKSRGGRVKDLYGPDGKRISYYQVNATFFSALDENPKKMMLARTVQLFMPGRPQIWYLDLFAGTNNYAAADKNGHKEINRTNLSKDEMEKQLENPLVQEQLQIIGLRNSHPAFSNQAEFELNNPEPSKLELKWKSENHWAHLTADFKSLEFTVETSK
jgi:sucrose phosphorylase